MAQARTARMRAPSSKGSSRAGSGGGGAARSSRAPSGAGAQTASQAPATDANDVDAVLDLQESFGNRAVAQLLAGGSAAANPPPRALPGAGNRAVAATLQRTPALPGVGAIQHATVDQRAPAVQRAPALQREMAAGTDPKMRVQVLRDAIRIDYLGNEFRIDRDKVLDALSNLTADEGKTVIREYQAQMTWNLGWILSATQPIYGDRPATNNLSKIDRTRLQYMLLGTVEQKAAPEPPQAPAAPVLDATGVPLPAIPPPRTEVDKQNEVVGENRLRVTAAEMKIAIDRKDVNKAISLIPKSREERDELNVVYEAMFGSTAYMALFTKLPGKDGQRASSAWVGEFVEADRLALESATEKQAAAEKEAADVESMKLRGTEGWVKEKRQAAKAKVEAEVKRVATVGDQTSVAGRAASRQHLKSVLAVGDPKGDLAKKVGIGSDAVLKAVAEGDEPGEMGARLARADAGSDISNATIESALKDLRQLAVDAAERMVDSQPELLGNVAGQVEQMFVDGYFDRFVNAFDANQKRRKFDQVVGGYGGAEEKAAAVLGLTVAEFRSSAGISSDVARNRDLLAKKGKLEEWQEVYYALTRKSKDYERVRAILATKTFTQVQELAAAYAKGTNYKRSLETDIAGTPIDAAYAEFFKGEVRENLLDRRSMLRGGKFDRDLATKGMPANLDEDAQQAHLLQAEGNFIRGRISSLERRVIENRGLFARTRDWLGNEEKDILDKARRDGLDAAAALSRAMTPDRGTTWKEGEEGAPLKPDLEAARAAVKELRNVDRRLTHAVGIYKEATKRAFEEFVNFVVTAASIVAGFGVAGIWAVAVRQAVATVGTKLLLKGSDYSVDEFLMDVGGSMAGVGGNISALGVKKLVTPYVGSKIIRFAGRVGMSKQMISQVRERLGPLAIRQAEYTFSTGTTNALMGKSVLDDQGLMARVKAEAEGKAIGTLEQAIIRPAGTGGAGAAEAGGARVRRPGPDDDAAPARKPGPEDEAEPTRRPDDDAAPAAPRVAGPDGAGSGAGGDRGPAPARATDADDAPRAADEADLPATPMALPERPTRTPSKPRKQAGAAQDPGAAKPASAKPAVVSKPAATAGAGTGPPEVVPGKTGGGPRPTGGPTNQGAGQQTTADAAKTWKQPNTKSYRPAVTADADGNFTVHNNVEVHPSVADADLGKLLVELDRTPWGEKIADRIRSGDLQVVIMPPTGPDFPFGGLAYPGGKTYIAWGDDIRWAASNMLHEGSHDLDPAMLTTDDIRGASRLGTEAEARAWEYEYNQMVGLPPRQPSEEKFREAYAAVVERTRGNPEGPNLELARQEAELAMIAEMRKDPSRYAVETDTEEKAKIEDRREPERLTDRINKLVPEPGPVPDQLEIESIFDRPDARGGAGGDPRRGTSLDPDRTRYDLRPAPEAGRGSQDPDRTRYDLRPAPERSPRDTPATDPDRTRHDLRPAPSRRGQDPDDWVDAPRPSSAARARRPAATEGAPGRGRPGPTEGPGPRPTAAPGQRPRIPNVPDTGLVGDFDRPDRRAATLPARIYESAMRPMNKAVEAALDVAQQRARTDIEAKLASLENGGRSGADHDEFKRVMDALGAEPGRGTNQVIIDHANVAWDALHDPKLIADVVSRIYAESLRRPGSGGLDPLTKAMLREAAVQGPIWIVPPGSNVGDIDFFKNWVRTGRQFLDLGIDTAEHGQTAHLLQGLIVDEAFKRAGLQITSAEFRKALANAEAKGETSPGNILWIRIYDGSEGISKPEILTPALREIPGLESLR